MSADRAPTFLRNSSSVQLLRAISAGPPEDPVLQALKAGISEHRNESVRLFGKLAKLGQGIHLPHVLVDEMQAMAREHVPDGGEWAPALLVQLSVPGGCDIVDADTGALSASARPQMYASDFRVGVLT